MVFTDKKIKHLTKFVKEYNPHGRFHISSEGELKFRNAQEQPRDTHKPIGLWYSVGHQWSEWLIDNQPEWITDYIYKVTINKTEILRIINKAGLDDFIETYVSKDGYVNWWEVSKKYDGIEVYYKNIYNYRDKYIWLWGWDVDSGCIWNKRAIKSIEKVHKLKER